jgi:hypothetical protein
MATFEMPELAHISEARRLAAQALMLLEHPKMKADEGSGLYVAAFAQARLILYLVQESERCMDAEKFDVLQYLICCQADGLAGALSLLRTP